MSIIAAVDLSPLSVGAARTAAAFAKKLGDKLLLVHAFEPASIFYPELFLAGPNDFDAQVLRARTEALEALRASLSDGLAVETRVSAGRPADVIATCAQKESARLVVMGTQGRGATGRLIAGSVAQQAVLSSPCPVLVLREGSSPFDAWLRGDRPLRVLAGVDQSAASDAALEFLATLGRIGHCEITLVCEYWPPAAYARFGLHATRDLAATDPAIIAILTRDLQPHIKKFLGPTADVTLRVQACWGRIGDGLALDAESDRADVLVVGTRQPHGWDRLRGGSTALVALHSSPTPIVCVPGAALSKTSVPVGLPALRSVLVATDLSVQANTAIPHAYGLLRNGGVVHLCHVHERSVPFPAYVLPDAGAMGEGERVQLESRLQALVPAAAAGLDIKTQVTVVDGGTAADGILASSRRLGVDAVVIASHGRSGLHRTMLGSVAESVVRGSEVPVYVVRESTASLREVT